MIGVLILSAISVGDFFQFFDQIDSEVEAKLRNFGIFLFFTIFFDLLRRLIKWYFEIDSVKLSPWDIISNDYALITQMLFTYARKNHEKGKQPLLIFVYIAF